MISLTDIHQAASRLRGQLLHTPCVESKTLSQITQAQVFLKFENLELASIPGFNCTCNHSTGDFISL